MKLLVAACALLMLYSCASTPPPRQASPAGGIPLNWQSADLQAAYIDSLWWEEFEDPGLSTLITEAFDHNYSLHMAAANVEAAAAQARIAGAPRLPSLAGTAAGSRRKQNFIGLPIPGSEDRVLTNLSNTFGVSLEMSWELDLWGRMRSGHIAALANVEAAVADLRGARLSLAGQVCKSWFAAVEAARQVQLAEATLANRRLSSEQVYMRYRAGLASALDYRLSLASHASAEATFHLRSSVHETMLRQLELLLGRYPAALLETAAQLPAVRAEIPQGLPSEVVSRRPDLVSAERRWLAADASVAASKRALLPSITLTGSAGTATDELKNILKGDFSVWSIAGGLLQPLFQGGRLRANVKLNESQAGIARYQYLDSILRAFAEVETALSNENHLREQQSALEKATEQSLAARDLAESQYAAGVIDFLSLLDAQRSAYESESRLLQVRRERLDARIDLYLALGGDFKVNTIANETEEL